RASPVADPPGKRRATRQHRVGCLVARELLGGSRSESGSGRRAAAQRGRRMQRGRRSRLRRGGTIGTGAVNTASTTIDPSVGPITAIGVVSVVSTGETGIFASARCARTYAGASTATAPTQASGLLSATPSNP